MPATISQRPRRKFAPLEFVPLEPPPLQSGDHLAAGEFERRYEAMPEVKKAELINGVVFMSSPVSRFHADAHAAVVTWLKLYAASTRGVRTGDNVTLRLDSENEVQPDAYLGIQERHGGQLRFSKEGYLAAAPEFIAEIAVTSSDNDLHDKFDLYRRHRVREYLVWQVLDGQVRWFGLHGGRYAELPMSAAGLVCSRIFPGLWLDTAALLADDFVQVHEALNDGLKAPEHAELVKKLSVK